MQFPRIQRSQPARRVVVTGVGIVTPLGLGWALNAEGFRIGRTTFRPVTGFNVTRQRARQAAEVDLPQSVPRGRLDERHAGRLDRAGRMLLHAMHEAWGQSGWADGNTVPLVLGTTGGGMSLGEDYYREAIRRPLAKRHQPSRAIGYQAHHQGRLVASAFGLDGPVTVIANACASGANAVGHAWSLVQAGVSDRVMVGGYDGLCQLVFAGFDSLQALSPTVCRPFDARRDGLALGEGAAVFTLESLDSARARGAMVLAEIAGYGAATDVHHLTQPHPEGDAAFASMTEACRVAGLGPGEIDYINAHGTGTPLNDSAEAAAIRRWAGARVASLPVSSTKSSVGHLLGAAGAVEVAVCLMALRGQWLPPTSTLETPDPICTFPLVTFPTKANLTHAMTNSFGFGGANATIILRRCG